MSPARLTAWLRLPLDLLKTVAVSVWSLIWIPAALAVRFLTGSTRLPLAMARRPWASGVLRLTGFRTEIEGREEIDWSRPYFITANHQSFLDVPVLFDAVPVGICFVVKKELERVPVLSWYIRAMGMIFVDRSRPEKARRSLSETLEAVASGKSILLFPEGTRSRDGKIGRLKSGMLSAAAAGDVPVLPVAIFGTGRGLPPGWLPRYRPASIRVRFGRPISTERYSEGDRRELADEVKKRLESLYSDLARERHTQPERSRVLGS